MKFDPPQDLTPKEITDIFREFFSYVPLITDGQKSVVQEKLPTIYKYLVEDEVVPETMNLNKAFIEKDGGGPSVAVSFSSEPASVTLDKSVATDNEVIPTDNSILKEQATSERLDKILESNKQLEDVLAKQQQAMADMRNETDSVAMAANNKKLEALLEEERKLTEDMKDE